VDGLYSLDVHQTRGRPATGASFDRGTVGGCDVTSPVDVDADAVRDAWHERSGEFSPAYYAYYGPDETSELVFDRLAGLDRDAAILELGCGSGRHLAHLYERGFRDLAGIEINQDARAVIREHYPDLARVGRFRFDAIETVLPGIETDAVDAVFAVETLQHIHPDDEWVFAEVARIAAEAVVTAEIETPADGGDAAAMVDDELPIYYRDWGSIFTGLGLVETEVATTDRDVVRTFRVR
jgi:SAM-dependent methyltransferase